MNDRETIGDNDSRSPFAVGLGNHHRRRILATLVDRDRLTQPELVQLLADGGEAPAAGSQSGTAGIRCSLVHRHLPALAAVGLVRWDRDEGTVATTAHPMLADPRFRELLDVEDDDLPAVVSGLSNHRRRRILETVTASRSPLSRAALVQALCEQRSDGVGTAPRDELESALYHVHLPKLAQADLIEYDPGADYIADGEHPLLAEVRAVLGGRDERPTAKLDGFLDGLGDASRTLQRETGDLLRVPDAWTKPSHG